MPRFFDRRLLDEARAERLGLLLTIALGALGGLATVGQALALSRGVDAAFLGGLGLDAIRPWLGLLAAASTLRAAATWGAETAAGRVAARVKSSLRQRLLAAILARGPAYTQGERTGELVNTAVEGVEALDAYFSQYLPQVALAAIVPLTFLALVFPVDPLTGLVLLVTAPLIPFFMALIGSLADGLARRQWGALSRMSAYFLDVLQGLATLKLFGRSREQIAFIRQITDQHRDATLNVLRVAFLSALVLEMVGTLSTAIVAVEIGLRLLYGKLAFQQAFFVLILAPEFYLPLRLLGTRFHAGIAGVTAARRIYAVLTSPPCPPLLRPYTGLRRGGERTGDDTCPPSPDDGHAGVGREERSRASNGVFSRAPGDDGSCVGKDGGYATADACSPAPGDERSGIGRDRGFATDDDCPPSPGDSRSVARRGGRGVRSIRFEDVSFTHADRHQPVLDRVSFEIRPGEKLALVGATGAGKSTVAGLLLGFSAPTAGRITIDGQPLSALSADVWRRSLAWVPQPPHLFDASVAENIRLGQPDATDAAVERAAQSAGADAFIRALPLGYATPIGERGSRLSAGQAQRIALARAFLLDAPFVILDEATANLDAATEADIHASIERLLAGRSVLIITHRLQTLAIADRIVRLQDGRVVGIESGRDGEGASGRRGERERGRDGEGESGGEEEQRREGERESGREEERRREGERETTDDVPSAIRHPLYAIRYTPSATRTLARLLAFLVPFWPWVALSVLLGFLTIGSSIGLLAASAWIIATSALQPSVAVLQVAIVGVRFFGISRGVFRYLERLTSHQVTFRVLAELRTWLYATIEPLAPARLSGLRSGDLLSRIVADVGTLEHFYIRAVAPPLVAVLTMGLTALLLGSHHASLIGPVAAFQALTGLGLPLLMQALSAAPGRRLAEHRAALNAALVDGVQGTADLLAFGAAERYVRRVRALSERLGETQIRIAALSGLSAGLGIFFTWLAVLAVLLVAIPLVGTDRLAGVSLAVLVLATAASFEAVLPLPLAAQHLAGSLAAARRLFDLAGEADAQPHVPGTREAPGTSAELAPSIRFDNVTLRYAADEPPALAGVSLDVPAGGMTAIVGCSGAGKSSLANALVRFWDYEAGEIWLGGRELRQIEADDVRRQIGVVAHDTHLFNLTIRDNLLLARPDASQDALEAACRTAAIHDFIAALPDGYATWVGEGGVRLSGGERQRLAIARALVKDAPIVILDEPTAHLDVETEQRVIAALRTHLAGRTTLVITHRLPFALAADQIAVVDGGRVIDQGQHAELLSRCAVYRALVDGAAARLGSGGEPLPPPSGG